MCLDALLDRELRRINIGIARYAFVVCKCCVGVVYELVCELVGARGVEEVIIKNTTQCNYTPLH